MKKLMFSMFCAGMFLFVGTNVSAVDPCTPTIQMIILDKVLMYVPNRIMDLVEIVSLDVETGATAKIGVRLTYCFGFGGCVGSAAQFSKGFNRTWGISYNEDCQGFFMFLGKGKSMQYPVVGNLPEYSFYEYKGLRLPSEEIFKKKIRDYWSIEVEAAAFVGARVAIHPLNIADCICGLFCYDLLGNDYKLLID